LVPSSSLVGWFEHRYLDPLLLILAFLLAIVSITLSLSGWINERERVHLLRPRQQAVSHRYHFDSVRYHFDITSICFDSLVVQQWNEFERISHQTDWGTLCCFLRLCHVCCRRILLASPPLGLICRFN